MARLSRTIVLAGALCFALCSCARSDQHQPAAAAGASVPVPSDLNRDVDLRATAIDVKRGSIGHLMPMDSPQNDIDTFTFSGTNRSGKAIASIAAIVLLQDQAGNTLYRGAIEETAAVAPAGTFQTLVTADNDITSLPNPELVRAASVEQAHLSYRVQAITYADGTNATAAPAP